MVAAIIGVIVLLVILFLLFGTGLFSGGDGGDTTTVEAPEIEVPDEVDVNVESEGDEG